MLQVPPTGAPTARITSRAPQTDPSDLAFAGMMAQAALPVPNAAPRPQASASRPTAADKSPAPPEAEGGKATERPEASPADSSLAERSENSESKPASEKEAAPAGPPQETPGASLSGKIGSEPLPAPILPEPVVAPAPQLPVPAGSLVPVANLATTERATASVLPPPRGSDLAVEAASPHALPEAGKPPVALATPESIPAPAPEMKAPEAIRAVPPPNPAASAKADAKVDLPFQTEAKGESHQPLPFTPGPASGKSTVPDAPATASQTGMAGVQAQPAEAGRTKEASGKPTGFSISEEGPRLHEPSPGAGSQKNLGDLAKGLQGQLNLTAAGDPVPRNEAAPQFQISKPMEEAPAPAGLPKSHVLEPLASPDASPKEQPLPRAQEAPAPHTPVPTSVAARDTAVALPRSESLGLQPTQGGLAAVALPRDAQAATAKAPAPMQWQAPVPSLVNQVEGGIRWMLRSSTQGAELQLHPENLGRVRIELKVEGSEVHARLWATDPKSLPILQDNKAFLEVSLREQGLNLGSFDLRQNPQQAQTRQQPSDIPGQFWATEAPKPDFRQETPILAGAITAQARRLEIFV